MKIGVFIDTIAQLHNWQLRILQKIITDDDLSLALLVEKELIGTLASRTTFKTNLTLGYDILGISGSLLKWQYDVEKYKLFKSKGSVELSDILPAFTGVPKLKLGVAEGNQLWSYDDGVVDQIQNLGIDLIINLSSTLLTGSINDVPKKGSWALLHKVHSEANQYPTGFYEVLNRKPVIGCTLLKLGTSLAKNEILDTSFFNRHWSMLETQTIAQEGGVSLLFKNIDTLRTQRDVQAKNEEYAIVPMQMPTLFQTLGYLFKFYFQFADKVFEKLWAKLLKRRYECWTVFVGEQGFYENITSQSTPLKMPSNEFWADPFLFSHMGNTYVFFENYSYKTKKGKLSCGILKNNELVDVVTILDKEYHLSFPYIFEEDGEVYMMPETSANERLEIYKAVNFPTTWELCVTAFEGERVVDAFFHTDDNQQKWLFLNKQAAITAPMNSELFIYKVDSFKLQNIVPHVQNPVVIDARVARNGGSIFKHDGTFYRPSQRNIDGVYGRALNINKIEKLNLEEYQERTVTIIDPSFNKKLIGLHHLHQLDGKFVFDAAFRKK